MCKFKKVEAQEMYAGKMGASEINAMAIGTDCFQLNHDFNFIEIGQYQGQTTIVDCGNKKLHFVGGILVKIEEE